MSAEDAVAHLSEAKSADVRGHLLASLLARPGVLKFIDDFDGDPAPAHVAEAAQLIGLQVDDIDVALLALALGHGREALRQREPAVTGGPVRLVETRATPAQRWREMSAEHRVDVAAELMATSAVRSFSRRYLGDRSPVRVFEGALSDGILLDDDEAVVLARIMGWNPE